MKGPQKFRISVGGEEYPLIIGFDLGRELLTVLQSEAAGRRVALIADARVAGLWGRSIAAQLRKKGVRCELFTFKGGEKNKNQATATKLSHELLEKHFGRDSFIIALGGGVTGDLAGYVAATYLRGVPYIHMPTTLLAMVDSSIGGKVGIDTPYGKNTLGAFWQPRAVVADLAFLKELPTREVVNGLLEAIKTFFTSDREGLALVREIDPAAPIAKPDIMREIVTRSVRFKAGVTERDEREENERRVLNFGHTVGHAIELLSGFKMLHGYAVGVGMLVEAKMAEVLGLLPHEEYEELERILGTLGIHKRTLRDFPLAEIMRAMKADKKARAGKPYYVLLRSLGSVHTKGGQYAHHVGDETLRAAYNALTGK